MHVDKIEQEVFAADKQADIGARIFIACFLAS